VPLSRRTCLRCQGDRPEIDDEEHLLLRCQATDEVRDRFAPLTTSLQQPTVRALMAHPNARVVARFVHACTKKVPSPQLSGHEAEGM